MRIFYRLILPNPTFSENPKKRLYVYFPIVSGVRGLGHIRCAVYSEHICPERKPTLELCRWLRSARR